MGPHTQWQLLILYSCLGRPRFHTTGCITACLFSVLTRFSQTFCLVQVFVSISFSPVSHVSVCHLQLLIMYKDGLEQWSCFLNGPTQVLCSSSSLVLTSLKS